MNQHPADNSSGCALASGAATGQLADWFARFRDRLRATISLRMDRRIAARIDPSDVIQETWLEAARRFEEYAANPSLSPFVWLRFLTMQRLMILHRRHLQQKGRDAGREVSLHDAAPGVSSECLAARLADSGISPSAAAARSDELDRLRQCLERLGPADREVLALRHLEGLDNQEVAEILGIHPGRASHRYYEALQRLREVLEPPAIT